MQSDAPRTARGWAAAFLRGEATYPPPRSARPRLEMRDGSSWWEHYAGGAVVLVVYRRVPASEGGWLELRFPGADQLEALDAYDDYCTASYQRSRRQAERRGGWRY